MDKKHTVAERIRKHSDALTRAERQLVHTILEDYPLSGLGSITTLSKKSDVSSPTIVRLARKLGFSGFPQLQAKLREEVEATISNPIKRHERQSHSDHENHFLDQFAGATIDNLRSTLAHTNRKNFDAVVELLTNKSRHIHIIGGRITQPLAEYLYTHLQMIRDELTLIAPGTNKWPHYIVSMKPSDVLIIFDIRRYERETTKLAQAASERKLDIILFTDQWGSPITKIANHKLSGHIEAPSASDSCLTLLFIVEALTAAIQNKTWPDTRNRLDQLEKLFDQTQLFRKFV